MIRPTRYRQPLFRSGRVRGVSEAELSTAKSYYRDPGISRGTTFGHRPCIRTTDSHLAASGRAMIMHHAVRNANEPGRSR